jgi:hypothetical protein
VSTVVGRRGVGLPKLTMSVASIAHPEELTTTITFDGLDEPYVCSATAPLNPRRETSLRIALQLSVVRALHELEHEMMEHIHEQIDRVTDDV